MTTRSRPAPEFLGQGRHRAAFRIGPIVVKVPLCEQGAIDNFREARLSRLEPERMARTRLINIHGHTCAVAEYIEPVWPSRDVRAAHEWFAFIDCCQVGRDRHGNWKAYDFA